MLPGCLRDFDVLATEFNEEASKWLNSAGINAVVGKAEAQAKLLSGEDAAKAKVYVQVKFSARPMPRFSWLLRTLYALTILYILGERGAKDFPF